MEGTPPERRDPEEPEEQAVTGGWLPPQPPGSPPSPGVFAPPPPQPGVFGPPPADAPAAPPPAYGPPPPAPPPGWQSPPPWQQPGYGGAWGGHRPEPGNSNAVTGFVLSVVGLGLLLFSAGLSSLLSIGLAAGGMILGRRGRDRVDAGETRQHRGLGQAGFIIGIVGLVLAILATLFWVTIAILAASGDLDEDDDFFDDDTGSVRALRVALALAARALG